MPIAFLLLLGLFAMASAGRRREDADGSAQPWHQEHKTLQAGPPVQLEAQPREGWEGGGYRFLPNHLYWLVIDLTPAQLSAAYPGEPDANLAPAERTKLFLQRWGDALERAIRWHVRGMTSPRTQEMVELLESHGIPARDTVLVISTEPQWFATPNNPRPFGPFSDQPDNPRRIFAMGLTASDAPVAELKASAFRYVAQAAWAGA
jgi:hypothetical protein